MRCKVLCAFLLFLLLVLPTRGQAKVYLPLILKGRCMAKLATLEISDGVTTVNLLNEKNGVHLAAWSPAIIPVKGNGVFQSSSLAPGQRLVHRVYGNAIETLTLHLNSHSQDALAYNLQELFRLLEKATAYWLTDWSSVTIDSQLQNAPVWIKVQANCETNPRYAVIHHYQIPELSNPFEQPFFSTSNVVAMDNITLVLERGHWLADQVGSGTCVQIDSLHSHIQAEWVVLSSDVDIGTTTRDLIEASTGSLYAASDADIIKSTDDGVSWSVNHSFGTNASALLALANGHLLAGGTTSIPLGPGQIYRSIDDGGGWGLVESIAGAYEVVDLVQLQNDYILALYQHNSAPNSGLVRRSIDNGASFSNVLTGVEPLRAVQQASGRIIMSDARGKIYLSSDDGTTWTEDTGVRPGGIFSLFESATGEVYGGTTLGEIWRLRGSGGWSPVATGLPDQIYDFAQDVSGLLFAAVASDIYQSSADGDVWTLSTSTPSISRALLGLGAGEVIAGDDSQMLKFEYGESLELGNSSSCDDEHYVINAHFRSNITSVKVFESGGATYTDQFPAASFPFDLLPDPMGVGDILYIGVENAVIDSGPFSSVIFNIGDSIQASSWTIIWEYSLGGSSWSTLTVQDNTNSFGTPGVKSIHFVPPTDWASDTIDSIAGLWIRARLTALTGSTDPPTQQSVNVFVANGSDVNIAASAIGGDIPAIARFRIRNQSDVDGRDYVSTGTHTGANNVATLTDGTASFDTDGVNVGMTVVNITDGSRATITAFTPTTITGTLAGGTDNDWDTGDSYRVEGIDLYDNRILVGLRSYNRGQSFQAYLNLSNEQNPDGVTVTATGANTSFASDVTAPTGARATYNPTGVEAMATQITVALASTIARDFYGIFHAFLRVQRTAGSATDFNVQIQVVSGSGGVSFTTEIQQVQSTTAFEILDFGRIVIPASGQLQLSDTGDTTEIRIQASAASGTPDLNMYDLILIPTDEWAIDAVDFSNGNNSVIGFINSVPHLLDIDSVTNPRVPINTLVRRNDEAVTSIYNAITNGEAILQANERQKLWFFTMRTSATGSSYNWIASPHVVHSVQVFHNARYLGLRGNR